MLLGGRPEVVANSSELASNPSKAVNHAVGKILGDWRVCPCYLSCFAPTVCNTYPRAFFLRNLVLGYECGRVFSANVGLDSPSKYSTNWLSS